MAKEKEEKTVEKKHTEKESGEAEETHSQKAEEKAAGHAGHSEEKQAENPEENTPREKAEKSHSHKKAQKQSAVWVEYKPKEIEELIVNLANQGHSGSDIGAMLRDQHGIPSVRQLTKKTILQILNEGGIKQDVPEDLLALIRKAVSLKEHMKKNKKDCTAKRGYELTVSKIRRLVAYYIKAKRLPSTWRYDIETAALLVK